jgi:hypothetical protein
MSYEEEHTSICHMRRRILVMRRRILTYAYETQYEEEDTPQI